MKRPLTVYLMEVNLADLVHHVLVVKGNKAEPPVSVGHLVVREHALLHFAELLEVRLDILQTRCCRQSSDKDLLGSHYQLRVRLSGNSDLKYQSSPYYLLSILKLTFGSINFPSS